MSITVSRLIMCNPKLPGIPSQDHCIHIENLHFINHSSTVHKEAGTVGEPRPQENWSCLSQGLPIPGAAAAQSLGHLVSISPSLIPGRLLPVPQGNSLLEVSYAHGVPAPFQVRLYTFFQKRRHHGCHSSLGRPKIAQSEGLFILSISALVP